MSIYDFIRKDEQPPAQATTPPSSSSPPSSDLDPAQLGRWFAVKVQTQCDTIRYALDGAQNDAINSAALILGHYVPKYLGEDYVRAALTVAAHDGHHPADRARRSIESGLRSGMSQPQDPTPTELASVTVLPGGLPRSVQTNVMPSAEQATGRTVNYPELFIDGAAFILDAPPATQSVWGHGTQVLWANGEALMLCGGNGLGKTTLAGQLLRARLGLADSLLGYPVQPGQRRVLYLAMDRPEQTRRALARNFSEAERDTLAERLLVLAGPPPADVAKHPDTFRDMTSAADADTLMVDSDKDAAVGLSTDDVAAGFNIARQKVVASGCQMVELHHLVKRPENPPILADVFGGAFLAAGAGSILVLTGEAGSARVGLHHVKPAMDLLDPMELMHDFEAGTTVVLADPAAMTDGAILDHAIRTGRVTVPGLAAMTTDGPTKRKDWERARRRLTRLANAGLLVKQKVRAVGGHADGGSEPWEYVAAPSGLELGP